MAVAARYRQNPAESAASYPGGAAWVVRVAVGVGILEHEAWTTQPPSRDAEAATSDAKRQPVGFDTNRGSETLAAPAVDRGKLAANRGVASPRP